MKDFVEQRIIAAVRELLEKRVNGILQDVKIAVPMIEFGGYSGDTVVSPVINISSCERTEKERILLVDAYTLTISFSFPGNDSSEYCCYAYAVAVETALLEKPALKGVANRVAVTDKKYNRPKSKNYREGWELVLTLKITKEQ